MDGVLVNRTVHGVLPTEYIGDEWEHVPREWLSVLLLRSRQVIDGERYGHSRRAGVTRERKSENRQQKAKRGQMSEMSCLSKPYHGWADPRAGNSIWGFAGDYYWRSCVIHLMTESSSCWLQMVERVMMRNQKYMVCESHFQSTLFLEVSCASSSSHGGGAGPMVVVVGRRGLVLQAISVSLSGSCHTHTTKRRTRGERHALVGFLGAGCLAAYSLLRLGPTFLFIFSADEKSWSLVSGRGKRAAFPKSWGKEKERVRERAAGGDEATS